MALIARAFWRVIDGLVEGLTGRNSAPGAQVGMQMVRDPVCGTFVLPDRAVSLAEGSRNVFFCSTRCRDKYRARTA
jgi:YHS domain-containing protein